MWYNLGMDEKEIVIGILGGMGSYATLGLFERVLEVFPAEKEWDRPRVIIDNRCTMPSRVRAILYGEKEDELVDALTDSVQFLINGGATHIILACNTSHVFLDKIYERIPDAKNKIVHIIDELAKVISGDGVKQVFLLASEGTIETKIYSKYFDKCGIKINYPDEKDFEKLRDFIEAVKQNKINDNVLDDFVSYINNLDDENVILGCTELPILYAKCKDRVTKKVYDPLDAALQKMVQNVRDSNSRFEERELANKKRLREPYGVVRMKRL